MLYGTAKQTPSKRRLVETPTPGKMRKVGVDPAVATTVTSMYFTSFLLLSSTPPQHSLLQRASLIQALGEPPTSPLCRNHLCLPARCVQGLSEPSIHRLYRFNVCCFGCLVGPWPENSRKCQDSTRPEQKQRKHLPPEQKPSQEHPEASAPSRSNLQLELVFRI